MRATEVGRSRVRGDRPRLLPALVLVAALAVLASCQAPPEIQQLPPRVGTEATLLAQKMGKVAEAAIAAYETAETRRKEEGHWRELAAFHAANPDRFTPAYVRAQTVILRGKLDKVRASAADTRALLEASRYHLARINLLLEKIDEWARTGLGPEHVQALQGFLATAADKWIELESNETIKALEAKVRDLEAAAAEGE